MNLVSVNSTASQSRVKSLFNQSKGANLFAKGNTFSATVVGKNKNNIILEAFGNVNFETSFASIKPNIGDTLDFEVISTGNNNVALKLIDNITPTSTRGGVNQMSNQDIKELFKQSNFVKDEDSCDYIEDDASLKEEKVKISRAISKIQNQISYTSNNLSLSAVNELLAKGISMDKITLDVLNSMLQEIEADPNIDMSELDIEYNISNNIDKEKLNEKEDFIKALLHSKLPITDQNIENVDKAVKCFNSISNFNDSAIIHTLKEDKGLTLDNLYLCKYSLGNNNLYTDFIDHSTWETLKPEINKILTAENIDITKENIDTCKLLVSNELPITKDNVDTVSFLRNLDEKVDLNALILKVCHNIRKDISATNIDLTETVYNSDAQDLNNTYKDILRDLPNILPDLILTLESVDKPITLSNLRHALHNNNSIPRELPPTSLDNITYRRELAEIQLKLTSQAAFKLSDKQINIDTMPLSRVVEELKILEKESYGKTLTSIGAEPSTQNVERMYTLFDSINTFKPLTTGVFSDILSKNTMFSIEGISKSQLTHKAMEGYEAFLTAPNTKYGDSFNNIYHQFSSVIENLGINPTDDDIRAASILSRSKMDVTFENLMQVKVIDQKINYVQDTLHPQIAANIIKEGLNPLNMHIDEVISYIDSFNNEYGTNLKDKIAEHILDMDLKSDISKEERDSMVAIYRMLNEIQRNNGASLGLNIKSGHTPTLGHLLEASKYYTRTHGDFNYADINIDDNFGTLENNNIKDNSIRSLLEKTYQGETPTNISRIESLINTNENITPLMVNELTYNELLLNSTADKLTADVFSELISTNENLWQEPLSSLIDKIENSQSDKISESIEKSKEILENIKNIINTNPSTINFLEGNNIPPTLINIYSMTQLIKNNGYIGKKLNSLEQETNSSALEDIILDTPIEYIGDNDSLKDSLHNISYNLDDLAFESQDNSIVKEIKLLQNAIKVQNYISQKQESYSIPVRLHDKITNLNIYIPNGNVPKNGNVNIAISIDSPKLGVIDSYIKAEGKSILLYLNSKDELTLELLKDSKDKLVDIFNESDFNLNSILFNEEIEHVENPYNAVPKNIISKDTKSQMFELATNITKYLDKI